MDNQELRIGNTVLYNSELYRVSSGEDLEWMEYEPVILTEEWFKRMGFSIGPDYHPEGITYSLKVKGILITTTSLYQYLWIGGVIVNDNFKYVHQLQNLYFALTQEELCLKN